MVNLRKQINMESKPLTQTERNLQKISKLARNFKPKQVSPYGYEIEKKRLVGICGFEDCKFNGGFLSLPMCEDHAWIAFEILKNEKTESEAKKRARQQMIEWEEEARQRDREARAKNAARWKNQTSIEAGFIYYLLVGELIKIGYTRRVEDRLKAYPPHSVLLATHPGTLKVEKQMHHKFLHHLANGREWFNQGEDLIEHINQAKQDFKQHELVAA